MLIALSVTAVMAAATEAQERGPVDVAMLLENDQVQVLRLHLGAHEKTPMHDVTQRVVVWLSDAHFIDTYADGTRREEFRRSGDAEFVSTRRHAGENLSDQPMDFIAVVLKAPPSGQH